MVAVGCSTLMLGACSSDPNRRLAQCHISHSPETTTTVPEEEKAEADIEELVTDWYLQPFDTSNGVGGNRTENLTGLLRQRIIELVDELTSRGELVRSGGGERIEVIGVEVDLEASTGAVDVCNGSDSEVVVIETEEVLSSDDPNSLSTGEFLVELTDDGWKIDEWYPSRATGDPVECEFTEQ